MSSERHPGLARASDSVLVLVDAQERLWPHIADCEGVEQAITHLLRGAAELGVQVALTEQYPKGLGPTIPALEKVVPDSALRFEKASFSCAGEADFLGAMRDLGKRQAIVIGIEAHVCVLQTVFDLMTAGLEVQVPADAVSSRSDLNRAIALERMAQAGAQVSVAESVLFEWMERCDHASFKTVQGWLK